MEANNVLIEQTDKEIDFEGGKLKIKRRQNADNHLPNASNIASLDAANITFPLLLRKWKQGDYFYPLGMQKKKKLSKFFIDQKMSLPDKEKIWVIESNRKIVWIIGKRIDDRFKITPTTKEILEISLD
jgi:tRNA(Ile)-lysidine synthase